VDIIIFHLFFLYSTDTIISC